MTKKERKKERGIATGKCGGRSEHYPYRSGVNVQKGSSDKVTQPLYVRLE
jgi:hypothetical protein